MCQYCPPKTLSRRTLMRRLAGTAGATAVLPAVWTNPALAQAVPRSTGTPGRRTLIQGGFILSMDGDVGDFEGDILIEGKNIIAIGRNLSASDAAVIDARGRIVMPGFIDTHHHQFETALRSFLPNGLLTANGTAPGQPNYLDDILGKFSKIYRPEDVYVSELFGSLSQLDAGVTTVLDVSQIHHSPEHSDAAVAALKDAGRRAAFGYFEGHGDRLAHPEDARRLKSQYFSSDDQLLTMVMGGEIYLPGYERLWAIGRDLGLPIALHVVGSLGSQPVFDDIARRGELGSDLILIHMTGMSEFSWASARDAGAHVSLAVPIEMAMRHGTPPMQSALDHGIQPSLSSDVEVTLSADSFTQMRAAFTLQRAQINERALAGEADLPALLTSRDVLRFATLEGAKGLKLDRKIGSLSVGKEADIILLNAEAINVTPLNNVPGAVVTLMDRTNVESVLVAGRLRKWKGAMLDADIPTLRTRLDASRDFLFEAAGIKQDLFR